MTSVDTDVDTDVDHTDGEIDAEHAAEAEDRPCDDRGGATNIVMAAATGAEPADYVEAAASGAANVASVSCRARRGQCVSVSTP